MNKTTASLTCLAALSVGASFSVLSAATVVQSFPFSDNQILTASGTQVSAPYFSASAQPFNSSLGTLTSFTIVWDVDVAATITAAPTDGFSASASGFGGTFLVNSIGYNGTGSGGGQGVGPGATDSFTFGINSSQEFLVSNAGVTYDPTILNFVTGASPLELTWDTGLSWDLTGTGSLDSTITGSVTITYDYVASPIPEPSSTVAIAGLCGAGLVVLRRRKRQVSIVA